MMDEKILPVQYSCYFSRSRDGEQFIKEHTIGYVVSGSLELNDGVNIITFGRGDVYYCRRNHLSKYTKLPSQGADFRSVSIFFDQDILRNFSMEYGTKSAKLVECPAFQRLPATSILSAYMDSLRIYEPVFKQAGTERLFAVKQKEAILLLLQAKPELANILFDFSEPGKIDLEEFMNRNYHFNVELRRFAYLTGRSLSTFKRDSKRYTTAHPAIGFYKEGYGKLTT